MDPPVWDNIFLASGDVLVGRQCHSWAKQRGGMQNAHPIPILLRLFPQVLQSSERDCPEIAKVQALLHH